MVTAQPKQLDPRLEHLGHVSLPSTIATPAMLPVGQVTVEVQLTLDAEGHLHELRGAGVVDAGLDLQDAGREGGGHGGLAFLVQAEAVQPAGGVHAGFGREVGVGKFEVEGV